MKLVKVFLMSAILTLAVGCGKDKGGDNNNTPPGGCSLSSGAAAACTPKPGDGSITVKVSMDVRYLPDTDNVTAVRIDSPKNEKKAFKEDSCYAGLADKNKDGDNIRYTIPAAISDDDILSLGPVGDAIEFSRELGDSKKLLGEWKQVGTFDSAGKKLRVQIYLTFSTGKLDVKSICTVKK